MIETHLTPVRSWFLPESIGGYYISSRKLVGLEIHAHAIFATTVLAKGYKKTITSCVQQDIVQDELISLEDRTIEALKKISSIVGDYDELTFSISNNLVIFKEITVPLTDIDTIKMVAPFEVEPMLPFALQDAFFDILVTHYDHTTQKTTVQVAALKQSTVQAYITLLHTAGINPTKFSVHLFEFFSVFKEIPEYQTDNISTLCIETLSDSRQFLAIIDGELAHIRSIPRGADAKFVQDIQFTFDTFNGMLPEDKKIKRILLATMAPHDRQLINEIEDLTGTKTEEFLLYKVVHNNTIKAINSVLLTSHFIGSIGAALDLPYTRSINFLQNEYAPQDEKLMLQQFCAGIILFIIVFGSLILHTQLTQRKIKNEIRASQSEAVGKLVHELGLNQKLAKSTDLKKIIADAQAYVTKQEEIWFALSSQNRYSFLNYLQELFRRLDAKALGLFVTMLSINDSTSTMVLEGEITGGKYKDWDALKELNNELSRPNTMFTVQKYPQELKFSIKITLNKNYKED